MLELCSLNCWVFPAFLFLTLSWIYFVLELHKSLGKNDSVPSCEEFSHCSIPYFEYVTLRGNTTSVPTLTSLIRILYVSIQCPFSWNYLIIRTHWSLKLLHLKFFIWKIRGFPIPSTKFHLEYNWTILSFFPVIFQL